MIFIEKFVPYNIYTLIGTDFWRLIFFKKRPILAEKFDNSSDVSQIKKQHQILLSKKIKNEPSIMLNILYIRIH
ncbi:hypothetical protein DB895_13885 [Flavobacterium psychrotolerans]|uniref:Uncharacterized protein n=1 Tax=Flavobacterium psychrotolerans TaxID=2169410 RepID=A0A2U1JG84_9FLAO|nr:hypothetical protein DB895_13885 [Flavobacterium psychrotolerans]